MYLRNSKLSLIKTEGRISNPSVLTQTNSTLASFQRKIEQEFIEGSAIAPDLFAAAVQVASDTEVLPGGEVIYPIHEALNWSLVRFSAKARENLDAALFRNEIGSVWQAKLSCSLEADKKPYLAPKNNGSRAFLPSIPVGIRQRISQRYQVQPPSDGSFWDWVETSDLPIVLTEGGKKALCLLSAGYIALALYGSSSGVSRYDRIAGEKIRKLKPELIPDLQRFAVPGRKFILALDQDEKPKTRQKVAAALHSLSSLLTQAGCEVLIAAWNQNDGKGVDDLIVNRGIEAWENSVSEAVSFSQWVIARQLASEVHRKPDLNTGDREFKAVVSTLPREGIVALYGGKGSGKSQAIGQLIQDGSWLSMTPLVSLGRDQAEGWGGVFLNDGDRYGSQILKDGDSAQGVSVCIPSLLKVSALEPDTLVLDEISATLEFLLSSKLANKDGIRPLLLSEFKRRVQAANLVLIADADLSEEALQYVEQIRGERVYLVKSERKALTYSANVIDGSKNCAIALLHQRIEQMPEGKIVYINADSKAFANALAELLGRSRTLLITGDTSGGEMEAEFLASKGRGLPGLFLSGVRFIISSPSVTQGFSIEHHTDLIDSVWGFYQGCSIPAHSIAQALDRVRSADVPRFIWTAKKGSAYSRLSKAQTAGAFLKEFRQLKTTTARLVANSLTPEIAAETERIDWQGQNLQMLAALEVRRNRGMSALRETLIALLGKEGKQIELIKANERFSKAEIATTAAAVKVASQAVKTRHCEAVAAAKNITPEEAKELSDSSRTLTSEEALSLEKFYIAEFYRLESVSSEDVTFDGNKRKRRQIAALEALLSPNLATEATAKSIDRNPDTPQDWDKIAVRVWLLEQSGAADLIREIVAGKVEILTPDRVGSIAEFTREHSVEFRIAFGFRNVAALSDQQIVGEFFTCHGIKTKRRGNRNNLRYEVCKSELEVVLAIIKRRGKAIAPPIEKEVICRDVIPLNSPQNRGIDPTLEDLNDIRDLYNSADSPEAREAVAQLFPIEMLRRAISA